MVGTILSPVQRNGKLFNLSCHHLGILHRNNRLMHYNQLYLNIDLRDLLQLLGARHLT
jgi:hypothetical protein